jgi:hypothetical protein
MRWPFGRQDKMRPLPTVVLTEDEQRECQDHWRAMTQAPEGHYGAIREDLLDSFQRWVVGDCLMGRAERFLILCNSQPEYKEQACQAAAKACAVFPVFIYWYDFACVLKQVGKRADAKQMFREFLRRHELETADPMMQLILNQRDVEAAVQHARDEIQTPQGRNSARAR